MNVVGYLRVSTDRQAEEGLGLEVQEGAIQDWAAASGHDVIKVFRDEGISGSNGLETRVGLAEALELLNNRSAAGLVVYRLDRLARDLVLQEQLLAECWRSDAQVFSTSKAEGDYLRNDPSDPSRVDTASPRRGGSVREGHDSSPSRGRPQAQGGEGRLCVRWAPVRLHGR